LVVYLNPNSPRGNFSPGNSLEIMRIDLKSIGQEYIAVTEIKFCFLSPVDTSKGKSIIADQTGIPTYYTWSSLQIGQKNKNHCFSTSTATSVKKLVIAPSTIKTLTWKANLSSNPPFGQDLVFTPILDSVTILVGGNKYLMKVSMMGGRLKS